MENTPNLSLPYIMPSQAQKHVTHNEALRMLDALVHLAVLDRDKATPPEAPAEGDRYIVAAGATGAWQGAEGRIAAWQDGGWAILVPRPGWVVFVVDEGSLLVWSGSTWEGLTNSISALHNLAFLGIGTTADIENRFAAKLNKALWAARPTGEGGTGDLRYTLSKQGQANVLSLLMQTDWSGRAEIGLVGTDDLSLKVSADGSNWSEALKVDRQNGRVAFPATNVLTDFAISLLPDSGRFAGNAAKTETAGAFVFPPYLTAYNGSTVDAGGKYITNNTDYGGNAGSLAPDIRTLIDMIREPAWRRYSVEFYAAQFTMGSGTATTPVSIGGMNYYYSAFLSFGPRAPRMTFHCYLRALDAPIVYRCYPGQTMVRNGVESADNVVIAPAHGWVSMTVHDEQSPRSSYGYNPYPFNVYCAQAGHRWLLACPALMGGITRVDDNVGVIAGINRWLP